MTSPRINAMNALTLRMQDEVFAIEATCVREILEPVPVTEVPGAPSFAAGLINVRGRVVPLADLRVMFDMDRPPPDQDTRIVVIEIDLDGEPTVVGVLADKVYEVTEIEAEAIQQAPRVGMRWRPDFVKAIGKRDGDFIVIPDMGRIFETRGGRNPSVTEERAA